ncbi:MAG: glycosyltransferase family 1 protein [Candidatus Eisenbacteria bacterium]
MITVAWDARKLTDGGIGTYIRGVLGALAAAPDAPRLVALLDPHDVGHTAWPAPVRESPVRAGKYGLAEHWRVPAAARAAGADLLHAPHYTLPLAWAGPSVVTIHDLIHVRFPQFHPPGAGLYARAMAGTAARRARVVCTDSDFTKGDVVERLGVHPDKVLVTPLGVSQVFTPVPSHQAAAFRVRAGLPEGYVLYVGARKRHKNLALLLRAWRTMHATQRPPLVLSGAPWNDSDLLARQASELGVTADVYFAPGMRTDEDLRLLHGSAALYVQPSLCEGFGLPPLEAMACGTPVLSSNAGSLAEVLGEAARLLPPSGPEAWAHAVQELLADAGGRSARVARGVAHAAGFRWEKTAALTREAYARALGGR